MAAAGLEPRLDPPGHRDAGAAWTTLRFHQERLADAGERERQREHWRAVAGRLERALDGGEGPPG